MSEVAQVPQLRFPEFSGEWEEKRFDSLYPTVRNGFVGVATPYYVEEGVPYLQGKNIKSGAINRNGLVYINESFHQKSKKSQLRQNDIVMVQSGHVGECAVITEEFEDTNCHALLVSTPTHDIDSKFYINYFYSKFGRKKIYRITTGNTIKHILSSDLKIQTVSNPSYQEQQKIAAFLAAVDSKIEQLSKKQALLGEYKKGLMQQIFSQAIRFKANDDSEFPDWEEKKLGDVCKLQGGYAFKSAEFQKHGIPIIRISNISNNNDFIDNRNLVYYNEIKNSDKFIIKNGDLIVAMSGATTGKSSIYNLIEDAYLNQRVGLFKANNSLLDYGFLIQIVFSYIFATQLDSVLVAGAQPNVSSKDIEGFEISLPSKIEQNKIANFLSSIDSKIEQVGKQLDESKQFKKALLQQMFV
ncbi:MAG: restriction endonuclease subunit S [Candidatus Ruthia sp.]|nr:restriction endonuclease subunit S [Candidatus Ruthturnera sp.]